MENITITENDVLRIAHDLINANRDYQVSTVLGTRRFSGEEILSKLNVMIAAHEHYPLKYMQEVIEYVLTVLTDGKMHFAQELSDQVRKHFYRTYNTYAADFNINRMNYLLNNYLVDEVEVDRTRRPYTYYLKTR